MFQIVRLIQDILAEKIPPRQGRHNPRVVKKRTARAVLTLKDTPSDKDTAAPAGRADPSGRAPQTQAQAHKVSSA